MTAAAELTWPGAGDHAGAVLVVPVGATEQHGPHLPLTTDTEIAEALAHGLAARDPAAAVVAPAVAYGSSGEHAGFPGTLSIGQEATELLLVELGRSAAASFPRLLLLCAHGGNRDPVARAAARLTAEGRDVRAWFPRWPGDAHAGRVETSLMLALAPARVRLERAAGGERRPVDELLPRLRRAGVRGVSPNGVLGDPAGASAAEGRGLLAGAVDELAALVAGWASAAAGAP